MASITLRAGKGAPLTSAEVDANFTALNTELGQKLVASNNLSDLSNAGTARTNLGLAIGTNVQAWGADLDAIAALSGTTGLLKKTAANTWVLDTNTYLTTSSAASTYQPLDADLTAIAALTGTSGFLTTNGAGTWTVDTATYLTTSSASSTYLTQSSAASTYQTQSGMSSYLTTETAASTYQTQAGMSSYLTTASASSTYLPLAGGTLTGDLTLSGNARRILGDFTNATVANRTMIQTSTVNGFTHVGILPNGTSIDAQLHLFGASDPTNAPYGGLVINATALRLFSAALGTATGLPIAFFIGASEQGRVSTGGNFLLGTTTDNGTDKLQVNGSVSANSFSGSGANLTDLTSAQISGLQTALDAKLPSTNPTITGSITEDVYALTGSELNPANGTVQTITLSANTTFTDALTSGQSMIVGVNAGASGFAATWPAITWTTLSGTAPTLPTTGFKWVVLWKVGSTLYGKH